MPSYLKHLEQAEHNRDLAKSLIKRRLTLKPKPIKYRDWAAIIAFYSAVHLVEAYLGVKGLHGEIASTSPHKYRNKVVLGEFEKQGANAYLNLYEASILLRYLTFKDRTAEPRGLGISEGDAIKLVNDDLGDVKTEVERYLALKLSS